jgi:alpha-1,2-mannosyltransferase
LVESITRRRFPLPATGELVVFALGLVARLAVVVVSGGFGGNYGYDAGVYYAASDALIHGRVPYRDFVLLHPPGLMLALTPFALLGRLTSDHAGFLTASLAFTALGALNAVLVVRVARKLGLAHRPALYGGGFYALWYGTIRAEYLPRLETLGNFALLCGLLALFSTANSRRGWQLLAGGFAFGAAASVKIWWAVPLLLALAWQLTSSPRWRRLALTAGGAAGALVLINGPFFLLARKNMWQMVVTQQLGRGRDQNSVSSRLAQLSGTNYLSGPLSRPAELALLALVIAVALAGCVLAWRLAAARPVVVLAVVQVLLLLSAPSWFSFYTDYAGPAMSLTLAAAVGAAGLPGAAATRRRVVLRYGWLPAAAAALETVLLMATGKSNVVAPFPRAQLAPAAAHTRCLMSDSAMALIQLDVLSRSLSNGCQNWVDVTGRTYGIDRPSQARAAVPRRANTRWQRDVRAYLLSGDAVIIIRADGTGLSTATAAAISGGGVLARAGGYRIYRTPPG